MYQNDDCPTQKQIMFHQTFQFSTKILILSKTLLLFFLNINFLIVKDANTFWSINNIITMRMFHSSSPSHLSFGTSKYELPMDRGGSIYWAVGAIDASGKKKLFKLHVNFRDNYFIVR